MEAAPTVRDSSDEEEEEPARKKCRTKVPVLPCAMGRGTPNKMVGVVQELVIANRDLANTCRDMAQAILAKKS